LLTIETIDDILPIIKDRDEFRISVKEDYTVIDYKYILPDTFNDPFRLECRGIKFHSGGQIMARPLHKFFNIGEAQTLDQLPWDKTHIVYDKLDGSMIHPATVRGRMRLMTRSGITDVSEDAEKHLTSSHIKLCTECHLSDMTPIFEYIGPDNHIIIKYDTPSLTLIAVRDNVSGKYISPKGLSDLAIQYNVPRVMPSKFIGTRTELVKHTKELTGKEGYVIVWEDGLRVKIKGDDYVIKHKAKNQISKEKNILSLVLQEKLDDIIPVLCKDDAVKAKGYQESVKKGLFTTYEMVNNIIDESGECSRKEFALGPVADLPPCIKPLAWTAYDGGDIEDRAKNILLIACNKSLKKFEKYRPIFAATYGEVNEYQEDART